MPPPPLVVDSSCLSRSNRTRRLSCTIGNNYQSVQRIVSAAWRRKSEHCAILASPCKSSVWCVWLESWRTFGSEFPLWVLGSQGSIVPVKENVHAEPMIQSTGTPVIFVPLSSACASSPNWIPSFCHESLVLFRDVKPVQSGSFLCADETE